MNIFLIIKKINIIFLLTKKDVNKRKLHDPNRSMTRYSQDIEYEAYLNEKKFINEKLHDHWKKELHQYVLILKSIVILLIKEVISLFFCDQIKVFIAKRRTIE